VGSVGMGGIEPFMPALAARAGCAASLTIVIFGMVLLLFCKRWVISNATILS
jgi:hypothetical protein